MTLAITPPIMGPRGVEGLFSEICPANWEILTHVVEAHWLQDCGSKEHVSSDAQFGQLG